MQKGLKIDGQMRALAIALGGAAVMSVVAMFIPASIFESITGATGISELVPATGAPLGDTARALIAFGFGAVTFAFLAAYLLRKPATPHSAAPASVPRETASTSDVIEQSPSFMDKMRAKISAFNESRRHGNDVKELSDLPKLRAGDAHPDAPPRRPISAHRDFGEVPSEATPIVEDEAEKGADAPIVLASADSAKRTGDVMEQSAVAVIEPESQVAEEASDSLSTMVDRLEAAVAQRQQQLSKLEILATAQATGSEQPKGDTAAVVETANAAETVEAEVIPPAPRPLSFGTFSADTPKEARDTHSQADEMDDALRSALETLQRMNVRTR